MPFRRIFRFHYFFVFMFLLVRHIGAQGQAPEGSGIFKREDQVAEWKQQLAGVDYAPDKDIKLKFGDILATKEKSVVFHFGANSLLVMPYSVLRLHGVGGGEGETAVEPELLFGESVFKGAQGVVLLPGQSVQCQGTVYLVVDDEKFSMVASAAGDQKILPTGATESISLPQSKYLELGPTGETGTADDMIPDDIDYYSKMAIPEEAPKASVLSDQKPLSPEPLNEFWTQERVALLKDGTETEAGLAIARGQTRKQEKTEETQENIQVFDKGKGATQKTISYSTKVSVVKKAEDVPRLTSITIAGKTPAAGETLALKFKNLDDNAFTVSGKATTSEQELWRLFIRVNSEETKFDSTQNFEYQIRISQETPILPKVYNIMIGETSAETFTEEAILTRENLTSGRLQINGDAAPGRNILNFNIEILARDLDNNEYNIGTYRVEVDLAELNRVEVSIDGGGGWETAKVAEEWTYAFNPTDGDKYKIKVRAYDVMENVSEEQLEPYAFTYRYKTDEEMLLEVFSDMIRALLDEDRTQ